jgi:uncharacterized protein (DUF2252 family)
VRLVDELLADVTLLMADNGTSWGSLALSVSAARRIAQGSEADSDAFLTRRESSFAFLRGSAGVMAVDLAATPTSGIRVQACGDAHVGNFGQFATPERNIVFDVNDFDETLPGPFEWDLKRLATSLEVAFRCNGVPAPQRTAAVRGAVRSYRERMADYATLRTLDIWYSRIDADEVVSFFPARYRGLVRRDIKKSLGRTNLRALSKLTHLVDGHRCFVEDPPLLVRLENTGHEADEVLGMIDGYRASLPDDVRSLFDRFRLVDVARKVVGVGSVGTRCWVGLLEGPSHPSGDPLVLQVKEAQASVLEPYVGASQLPHHGLRVVAGQRLTQAASDIFLGWSEAPKTGRHYYVRQLWDVKGSGDPAVMNAENLARYGALCAWALARAHARTGDPAAISGYLGRSDRFDRAIANFATIYADQTEADHAALLAAIGDGRLPSS